MANITDSKRNAMLAIVGAPENIDDLENLYLQTLGATADIHINNQWFEVFVANGYTGNNWNDGAYFFLGTLGATALHINDRWLYFWDTLGGVVGPVVTIALNSGGSCDYIDPDTTCLASGTYEANDFGFTNPANSWVWSIVSGAAAIQGSTTEKTVVVTTNDVGADVDFVLKVIATDTVSTDSAERESALKQDHDNVTEAPAYIGPNINDRDYTVDVPITPVDTFNLFTGDALVFTLEGTWPTGLVIDSASGQITGTPTGALQAYPNLFVRVTNSKGIADSTQLTITLTSSAVAPLFDNGPVPDQDWPIDQAIAQFPIGQFFLTGSFPRTYTIESGAFPTGITMNTAGQINGTPTVEGETGSVVIRCTNSAGFALTNEWNWLTWEAVAFIGPIPPQTATIGVEYTHDYSQYFTGTVSDYVINTASWPPGTVLDPNTGIVTFTPAATFSTTNALIIANSDYTPPFVLSNNFAWDVTEASGPAFYALTPDPVTYEMKGVREGVGDLTTTHTASVYAPDFEGVYREFGANQPVWSGVRVVRNYARDTVALGSVWIIAQSTKTNGISDPDGGNNAATITSTGFGAVRQVVTEILHLNSAVVLFSVWIRRRTGTGDISVRGGSSAFTTVPVTTDWQRFTVPSTVATVSQNFQIGYLTASSPGDEFDFYAPQVEVVGGASDPDTPSDYIPSTTTEAFPTIDEFPLKVFANLNGNTVLNNVVTEAVGAPLAEIPYLQYYPAAENELLHSRDFANATNWTPTGCTAVADAVGLDGAPNTGVTVTGTGNTSDKINPSSIAGTIQSTGVLYYRKTGTDATHVLFQPHQSQWVEFNPQDGTEIHTQGIASWDWIDQGDVVKVVVEANGGVDSIYNVYPNRSGGTASIVLLQMERHLNKSIAEVRGLSPIFCTTAPSATDATVYSYDILNHNNDRAAYYLEYLYQNDFVTSDGMIVGLNAGFANTARLFQLNGFTPSHNCRSRDISGANIQTFNAAALADSESKYAIVYDITDNQRVMNRNNAYGPEGAAGGFGSLSSIILGTSTGITQLYPFRIREFKRFDITDFAEGKTIIDGEMA